MPWKRKRILILTPLSSFSRLFAFFRKIISHVIFKMIGLYDKDKDVAIKLPRTYIYNRSWWFLSRRESQSNFIFSKFVSFSESHAKDPKTRPFFRQTLTSPFFSLLFLTLEHIFHYSTPIFFEARRQFLKHRPFPKDLSKALLDRSIEHLSLFARGKIRGFFFFSPHQFQFLFSQFPTCGVVGRKVRRRESFHLVYRGTSIAAASRRLQFWSRGGSFSHGFSSTLSPYPSPPPP